MYDVRHAAATAMMVKGVHPLVASSVLGHADPAFTMRTYQHVLPSMTAPAADALDEVVSGTNLAPSDNAAADSE